MEYNFTLSSSASWLLLLLFLLISFHSFFSILSLVFFFSSYSQLTFLCYLFDWPFVILLKPIFFSHWFNFSNFILLYYFFFIPSIFFFVRFVVKTTIVVHICVIRITNAITYESFFFVFSLLLLLPFFFLHFIVSCKHICTYIHCVYMYQYE